MNELRDLISDPLVIGAIIFTIVMTVVFWWFLRKMEMKPAGDMDDLGDAEGALQSKVGTPRARRLQPARSSGSELNLPELNTATPAGVEAGFPVDSLAMAGEAAFAKKPDPVLLSAATVPGPAPKAAIPAAVESGEKKALGETVLSPLATDKPATDKPAAPAEPVGKKIEPPAGSLVPVSAVATETKPLGAAVLPPLAAATGPLPGAIPVPMSAAPMSKAPVTPEKPVVLPPVIPAPTAKIEPPAPAPEPVKLTEKPTAGPVEPVKVTPPPAAKPPEPPASAAPAVPPAASNDVKKQNTPMPTDKPEAATSGLILLPKTPAAVAEPAALVSVAAKASEPKIDAPKVDEPKPAAPETPAKTDAPAAEPSFLSKMMGGGRPRIFMPASTPAAPKPETESTTPAPASPAAAEAVPETPAALAPSTPPAAKVEAPAGSLTAAPEKPPVEPAKPALVPAVTPTAKAPTPTQPEPAKPVDKPVGATDIPAEDGTPAAPLVPEVPASTKSTVPPAPAPTPAKPAAAIPALVPTPPTVVPPPVPAANPPAISITTPPRTMAQTDTTTALPANARAAAQLTLGFEITSLQLTPFFKLGAVQLRPLSNIVSLHLIASSATDNPLAAGISFQIVTVELDHAAHLKSILLKPLPQAQPAAVPSQKLQVDNVQITQAGENAPISVTTSETTSTAVQLLADFTIASMDFTPSFEIGSLRLEPTSNSVLLRLAASQRPAALDLPPSFEVANVQLGGDAQLSGMRLTPGGTPTRAADAKS